MKSWTFRKGLAVALAGVWLHAQAADLFRVPPSPAPAPRPPEPSAPVPHVTPAPPTSSAAPAVSTRLAPSDPVTASAHSATSPGISAPTIAIADELHAGHAVANPAPGAIAFSGPGSDGGGGAKGILYKNPVLGMGSPWSFHDLRSRGGYPVQIIHPVGHGQSIVFLNSGEVGFATRQLGGEFGPPRAGATKVRKQIGTHASGFGEIFPLKEGVDHEVVSWVSADGQCQISISGNSVAHARAEVPEEVFSIEIVDGEKYFNSTRASRNLHGPDLPIQWSADWAANAGTGPQK